VTLTPVMRDVHGWACSCGSTDPGHQPQVCDQRYPITRQVPTYPDVPTISIRRPEEPEIVIPPPIITSRPLHPGAGIPDPVGKMLGRSWSAGVPAGVTYALGWSTRKIKIDNSTDDSTSDDRGRAGRTGRKTRDVLVRIESYALRSSRVVMLWTRRESGDGTGVPGTDIGWDKWSSPTVWIRPPGEIITRGKVADARRLLSP
jgi:hypothetical protein